MAVQLELNKVACTSKLCAWKASKRHVECAPLEQISFKRPKRGDLPERLPKTGNTKMHFACNDPTQQIPISSLKELYAIKPNCAVFTSMSDTFLEPDMTQDESGTDSAPEEPGQAIPEPLTSLFDPTAVHMTDLSIQEKSFHAFTLLKSSYHQEHYDNLTSVTIAQSQSEVWQHHRAGRITASRAHSALNLREDGRHKSFLESTLQYSDPFSNAATKWGIDNEATARKEYTSLCRQKHSNFHVELSGLVVCAQEPQFAASPDGITYCDCHARGLVEIKCPHKYRHGLSNCYQDAQFPLTDRETIKTNHPYYTQMQAQMMVCQVAHCDFFVWSRGEKPQDTVLIRVARNDELISRLHVQMNRVFVSLVLPELFTRKSDPKLHEITVKRYCDCKRPAFGRMIACEAQLCKQEWFHYSCVSMTRAPKGKWICHNCK